MFKKWFRNPKSSSVPAARPSMSPPVAPKAQSMTPRTQPLPAAPSRHMAKAALGSMPPWADLEAMTKPKASAAPVPKASLPGQRTTSVAQMYQQQPPSRGDGASGVPMEPVPYMPKQNLVPVPPPVAAKAPQPAPTPVATPKPVAPAPVAAAPPVPKPEPRPNVLRLPRDQEVEHITAYFEKQIEKKFKEGVKVIASQCIADGLDDARIEVTIDSESFRQLTKSVKRLHVFHAYITRKLYAKKQELYIRNGLPHSPRDLAQRYRIIDEKTGAYAEPLAHALIEKYDINESIREQTPQRVLVPIVTSETYFGRSEAEAVRSGQLTPKKDYLELPEVEGLSVFHLRITANDDATRFWLEYTGNEKNRRVHYHNEEPIAGKVPLHGPIVYGPVPDRPYMLVEIYPTSDDAWQPDDPEVPENPWTDAVDNLIKEEDLVPLPLKTEVAPKAVASKTEASASVAVPVTEPLHSLPLVPPELESALPSALHSIALLPPEEAEQEEPVEPDFDPVPHSRLLVSVYIKEKGNEDFDLHTQKAYLLHEEQVLVGRYTSRAPVEEEGVEHVAILLGDDLTDVNRVISREHVLLTFDEDGTIRAKELTVTNHAFEMFDDEQRALTTDDFAVLESEGFTIEGRLQDRDIRIVFDITEAIAENA